jgi:hypothetical protein
MGNVDLLRTVNMERNGGTEDEIRGDNMKSKIQN